MPASPCDSRTNGLTLILAAAKLAWRASQRCEFCEERSWRQPHPRVRSPAWWSWTCRRPCRVRRRRSSWRTAAPTSSWSSRPTAARFGNSRAGPHCCAASAASPSISTTTPTSTGCARCCAAPMSWSTRCGRPPPSASASLTTCWPSAYPRLVVGAITGWGSTGPWRNYKGWEALVMAKTGVMHEKRGLTPRPGPAYIAAQLCVLGRGPRCGAGHPGRAARTGVQRPRPDRGDQSRHRHGLDGPVQLVLRDGARAVSGRLRADGRRLRRPGAARRPTSSTRCWWHRRRTAGGCSSPRCLRG